MVLATRCGAADEGAVEKRVPPVTQQAELAALGADGQRVLVDAFVDAWERADVDAVVALLADDARFTTPPLPAWSTAARTSPGSSPTGSSPPRGGWSRSGRTGNRIRLLPARRPSVPARSDQRPGPARRADPREQIVQLKHRPSKEILLFGSHTLWNDLLVDELYLMIGPAVLSAGTPAFEGGSRVPPRLLSARTLEGSQLVLHRYDARPMA